MVNMPHGQEIQDSFGVRSLLLRSILRLVRLTGLSVLKPDKFDLEMATRINEGTQALITGFGKLKTAPASASVDADVARKAERRVEKAYRRAIAELFVGDDYINMFKRREIYRHLSNAADQMAHCANKLHDIGVKMC